MTSRDVARIFDVLLRIDAGGQPPRLSGPPGAFFRRYAAERDTIVQLAFESGVHLRRDGKLSGASIGALTMGPVAPEVAHSTRRTHWGDVERFLVLCPELLSLTVLRVWMSAASGREALRTLLTAGEGDTVRAVGDFRWSPPGAVTSGAADSELGPPDPLAHWSTAPFIKATADDLLAPVHPLDVRDIYIFRRPQLAQFRCVLLGRLVGGRGLVVGGLHSRPLDLELPGVSGVSQREKPEPTEPALALVFREAWSERWTVLLASPANPAQALGHIISWAEYMRALDPGFGRGEDIEAAARRSLEQVGIEPPGEATHVVRIPGLENGPLTRLAFAVNRRVRVGGAVSREGPGRQ
jgi:hypothetical protein